MLLAIGVARIVMGVDTEMTAGHLIRHPAHDRFDLVRQRAAVGIAHHHPPRTRFVSGARAAQGVLGIGLETVEEVLGVEHDLVDLGTGVPNAVGDHRHVLVEVDAERLDHLVVPALADHADNPRAAAEQGGEAGIVLGAATGAPGHAERGETSPVQRWRLREEGGIGRVGAGPAALDIVDADRVELAGDRGLIGHAEVDALRLRSVAQGRIVKVNALA